MPELRDPLALDRMREHFARAAFLADLGVQLVAVGPGTAETELVILPRHGQSEGFVHAGVAATMADHTAGTAGGTLIDAAHTVLTVEFKVNLLRPMRGERIRCRAEVLKSGRTISVVEAKVHAESNGESMLVAASTVTLAVVPDPRRAK